MGTAHRLVFQNGVAYDEKQDNYHVRSASQKNKFYIVQKDGKLLYCSCLGFQYNINCSHCVAVRIFQRSEPKK